MRAAGGKCVPPRTRRTETPALTPREIGENVARIALGPKFLTHIYRFLQELACASV